MGPMFLLFFFINLTFAFHTPSPVRLPEEDYNSIIQRRIKGDSTTGTTALELSENINQAPWLNMPESPLNLFEIKRLFRDIRDHRPTRDDRDVPRRLAWLYPDDGCYARSAVAQSRALFSGYRNFKQIFVFGNLTAKTENHPKGRVYWWYHVAPIVRIPMGVYVLDPTLDANQPLEVEAWLDRILPSRNDAQVSLCQPATLIPDSDCKTTDPVHYQDAIETHKTSLFKLEWQRILSLGRNPEIELGPPTPRPFAIKRIREDFL